MTPATKQTTEMRAAQSTTPLKLLHTRMAERAGKIIRLEIKRAPIIRIPSTTVTAVSTASRVLKTSVFVPVARLKVSSKVMAKMRG